jgi:hypothetical protein
MRRRFPSCDCVRTVGSVSTAPYRRSARTRIPRRPRTRRPSPRRELLLRRPAYQNSLSSRGACHRRRVTPRSVGESERRSGEPRFFASVSVGGRVTAVGRDRTTWRPHDGDTAAVRSGVTVSRATLFPQRTQWTRRPRPRREWGRPHSLSTGVRRSSSIWSRSWSSSASSSSWRSMSALSSSVLTE